MVLDWKLGPTCFSVPVLTSLSQAQPFSLAYNFPFSLASLSLLCTSWSSTCTVNSFLVCGFAAFYGTGVLQGLLQWYCAELFCTSTERMQLVLSNFSSLFVQSRSSLKVNSFVPFSSPCTRCQSGVTLLCTMHSSTNLGKSSLMMLTGSLWVINIFLRLQWSCQQP